MSNYFLDSNICVYVFDTSDLAKRDKAFQLISGFPWISSQVLIEVYNACRKKIKLPEEACEENALFLCDIANVYEMSAEVIKTAIAFKRRYGFSFLDACIVSTAYHAGCTILYSEDMHHGLVVERSLRIENPFL